MAYSENIVVSTMQAVIDNIVSFAVTNAGYIDEGDIAAGLPGDFTTTFKRISKNGMYYYFYGATFTNVAQTEGVVCSKMMKVLPTIANYDSATNAQYNQTKSNTWINSNGPFVGLNLYTDGNGIGIVLEVYSDVYCHLAFGEIDQTSTWTGGQYLMGNYIIFKSGSDYVWSNAINQHIYDGGESQTFGSGNYIYRPYDISKNDYRDWCVMSEYSFNSVLQVISKIIKQNEIIAVDIVGFWPENITNPTKNDRIGLAIYRSILDLIVKLL